MRPEKTPDGPYDVTYAGLPVISRYGKRHELETMMSALDWILDRDQRLAELIVELQCDSKACATYVVKVCHSEPPYSCSKAEIEAVGEMFDQAIRSVSGGHNGIFVDPGWPDPSFEVGPWWPEFDLDEWS